MISYWLWAVTSLSELIRNGSKESGQYADSQKLITSHRLIIILSSPLVIIC